MNVVDSSGWLEYFINGENDVFFAPVIENTDDVLVPTISLFEVFKRVLIEKNRDDALEAIALMKEGRIVEIAYGRQYHPCHCSRIRCHPLDSRRAFQRHGRRKIYRKEADEIKHP
jgi:hypothetical protein